MIVNAGVALPPALMMPKDDSEKERHVRPRSRAHVPGRELVK